MIDASKHPSSPQKPRRFDPARYAAAKILLAVYEKGAYANLSIRRLLNNDQLDARDRRLATAMVYETIARTVTLDWMLSQVSKRAIESLDPWIRTILRMGAWQLAYSRNIPPRAAIDQSVHLAAFRSGRSAAGYVNAVLRQLDREPVTVPEKDDALQTSLPPELFGYLKKALGPEQALAYGKFALSSDAFTTLRINQLNITSSQFMDLLKEQNVLFQPGLYCSEAIRVDLKGRPITSLAGWQEGWFSVQDEAAMLVGHVASPQPDQRIAAVCAAPGGKICHIAERVHDQGTLVALDIHERRLRLVEEQARRLRIKNVECAMADAASGLDRDRHPIRDRWSWQPDILLADVPCSGLGLLARKPEIRLHMNHQKIQALYPVQAAILDHSGSWIRPGGTLIYSTCTINPAENIEQIRSFIERHKPAFQLEPITSFLPPEILRYADLACQAQEGWIQLLPHRHKTDGFFIARLKKEA